MFAPLTPLAFYRRAEDLFGSKVGIVDGERRLTYAEFGRRVDRLAGGLRGLGVGSGDVVSLLTFNTHQLLEAYYAVPQLGAIVNPLNIRLFPTEIALILNHAESKVICFHRELLPLVEALRPQLQGDRQLVVIEGNAAELPFAALDYELLLEQAEPHRADLLEVDELAPAELFYTSGTTAQPKGVLLSHRTLAVHALDKAISLRYSEAEVFMHVVPMYHANGWGSPQALTMVGARHVMLRKFDPESFLRLIEEERVTFTMGVPVIFNAVVHSPALGAYDTSSLRGVMSGGSPVPSALVETVEEKLGCPLYQAYGLTETTPLLTLALPKSELATSDQRRRAMQATTGLPALGAEVRVVDAEGREVPRDGETVGEIVARGNHVMLGYYKDDAATAAAIRDGWFHTGDLATVDAEGYLQIVDRTKDIVISGGVNISSVEVENCLFSHPAVFECAVIAVPDEQWGEVPRAIVALKPDAQATEAELIAYCRERLAHFKAPKAIELREALPKSGTGKILKRELREPYWQGYARRVN
jgi:fatty-acyl-CoA synthase